ncbi:MFS transporter [Rhodococcus koreensis]
MFGCIVGILPIGTVHVVSTLPSSARHAARESKGPGNERSQVRSPATTNRPTFVVTVLAIAGMSSALMHTLVVPLLADLPVMLNTSPGNASWVVTITLLTASVFSPVNGRLGDLYGKRRMLLLCIVPLIVGSVICATASSLVPMLVGRALQGMGTGIIPLGISLMRDVVPSNRLNSSIALMSSSLGIGSALGLPIAAAVAEQTNWRILFWGAAVLNAVMGLLIWRFVPRTQIYRSGRKFDVVGAIGLGTGLLCLLLPLSKGIEWGWTSPGVVCAMCAAVVVLIGWVIWELRVEDPLVDLRVTSQRPVLLTNIAGVLVGFALYAQNLLLPQLLRMPATTGYGLDQSVMATGMWLVSSGLTMMAASPFGGHLSNRLGPKVTLASGCLLIAGGYAASFLLASTPWGVSTVAAICSAGVGLAYGALPSLIMSAVPDSETASANSFNTLMRAMGTTAASAVVGVILSHMNMTVDGRELPTENAFHTAMLIGCGVALSAAVVALGIPGMKRETRTESRDGDEDRQVGTASASQSA